MEMWGLLRLALSAARVALSQVGISVARWVALSQASHPCESSCPKAEKYI